MSRGRPGAAWLHCGWRPEDLLLWANLTGIALFVGVAFAAQLEARRVGISGRAVADQHRSWEERADHAHQPP